MDRQVDRQERATVAPPAPSASPRWHYLLQLVAVVALLGLFLSLMSASEVVDGGAGRKLFLLGRMAVLVLLCTWFLRRGGERWADLGLRRPRRWWVVPFLVVGGFVLLLVLSRVIRDVILPAIGAPPPQLGSSLVRPGDLAEYLFLAIPVAWGSAALGEELVIRGFLLDRIVKVIGSPGMPAHLVAILCQAALFGSFHLHQGIGGVLITGMVGLVLGLVWLLGGRNLWACILLHGAVNFITQTEAYTARPGV